MKDWSRAKFPLSRLCWLQHIHVGGEQADFKGFARNLKIDVQQEVVFFFQKSYNLLRLRDGKSADGRLKEGTRFSSDSGDMQFLCPLIFTLLQYGDKHSFVL